MRPEDIPQARSLLEPATLLLVEDNDDDIAMVRRTLDRSGTEARLRVAHDAATAMQALRAAVHEHADGNIVVLLDLLLPAVHGIHVIQTIRQDQQLADTPIVVLTGSSDVGMARRCLELGANMYVLKPLDEADVMSILVSAIRYWRRAAWTDGASTRRPERLRRGTAWKTPRAA